MPTAMKKNIQAIITGIRDKDGNPIPLRQKTTIRLHLHPVAIQKNIDNILETSKDNEELHNLFEDIKSLVDWSLTRLRLKEPPKENV